MRQRRRSRGFLFPCTPIGAVALAAASLSLFGCEPDEQPPTAQQAQQLQQIQETIAKGGYAEAEASARALLRDVERSHGARALAAARVLDPLVELLLRQGKESDPELRALAERAVAIKRARLPDAHAELAASHANLGELLRRLHVYDGARLHAERALAIRDRELGASDPATLRSCTALANVLLETGHYLEARPLYERALRGKQAALGAEHPAVASDLYNLAIVLRRLGYYEESRRLQRDALAITERAKGADSPQVAWFLNGLGVLLHEIGDYETARLDFDRALAIRKATLGPDHPEVAVILNNEGRLLQDMADFSLAEEQLRAALRIRESQSDELLVAQSASNLAVLLSSTGRYAEAQREFERALEIRKRLLAPDHPELASIYRWMGDLHRNRGDDSAAEPLYEAALRIMEGATDSEHEDVALSLNGLAQLRARAGDEPGARRLFERALAIRERSLGPDHPHVAEILASLAASWARTGETARALDAALRSDAIARNHVALTARTLPERQALGYASAAPQGLDVGLTLAARGLETEALVRVWDAVIRTRAMVLDEMATRRRIAGEAAGPEVARRFDELASARKRLAFLVVRGPESSRPGEYRALVDDARRAKEQAELALGRAGVTLREHDPARVGFAEVAQALVPGEALLAYVAYRQRDGSSATPSYLAFVLRGGEQAPVAVSLGPVKTVDALVSAWHAEVQRSPSVNPIARRAGERAYRQAGDELRRAVWDPVAQLVQGAQRLFVVPDGSLHVVSWTTLPVAQAGYLIESAPPIHYLSAERDIAPHERRPVGRGLLVLGGAAFGRAGEAVAPDSSLVSHVATREASRSECEALRTVLFEPLPESGHESEAIARLWARATSTSSDAQGEPASSVRQLEGTAASEASFKALAPGRRVLHLATHGFFLGADCAALRTRGVGGIAPVDATAVDVAGENPLLLSGLALAGANHHREATLAEEDGLLTAEEIASLDLGGVEWAVLSACGTGLGKVVAGEGVFGLRRAFEVAGARTVIISLWSVADEPTREWMERLYRARLLERRSTVDAVRGASLALLHELRAKGESDHPFLWGAFVAAGDWR